MKRLFDKLVSFGLSIVFLPFFVLIAIAVKIEGRGPVFYKQQRIGCGGDKFYIYKFRSMIIDADKIGGFQTMRDDQRVTRVGRFLRASSLDELPQLLNVLKGDMSLVGPRPDVPDQRSYYTSKQWQLRHTVQPGLTGLAQVILRSDATPEQRIALDISYVKNHTFLGDIKIILRTVARVVLIRNTN